jgi:regulator of sigma E protease
LIDNILWIPAFFLLLGILVFFHELGHFTVAKLLKVRVEEFAFGFGPKWITLFRLGETEYTIHPIPLGGFVKLAGEGYGEPMVEGSFNGKPWYQRWCVLFAGPLASFLLAYFVFCSLGMTVGMQVSDKTRNIVDDVMPGSLAEKAGLRVGDVIIQINDQPIRTGIEMVQAIRSKPGIPVTIVALRDHNRVVIHAVPEPTIQEGKKIGLLGFMATPELTRVGLAQSVKYGTLATLGYGRAVAQKIFSREVTKDVGGPIAIAKETKSSIKRGVGGYLLLIAMLSWSLGIVNLLPIPVVDGGQMLLAVIEGAKGKRLSQRTMEVAQMIGLATIAILFVMVMYLDISKLHIGH